MSYHSKQSLSIGMKLFLASGLIRMLIVLIVLLCSWAAILWSSLLP
ncbi:hypothetical protein BCHRO640_040 [Candidatus Blochmanniella chromaiodes str. 640]|uniref:Uncharacterized protein n=1 Tax=Candidatus Blochmanniella chromaiodes str. 640 TaxID=1240471 RepID=A0ABM5NCL5_9ENTR|nr:hypothetical protein BCHRO640_040 [Candidatus Blochmannia chromaiodes str. 640]